MNVGLDVTLTERTVDMVDEEDAVTLQEQRGATMCIALKEVSGQDR